jgi:hypothetical protein
VHVGVPAAGRTQKVDPAIALRRRGWMTRFQVLMEDPDKMKAYLSQRCKSSIVSSDSEVRCALAAGWLSVIAPMHARSSAVPSIVQRCNGVYSIAASLHTAVCTGGLVVKAPFWLA